MALEESLNVLASPMDAEPGLPTMIEEEGGGGGAPSSEGQDGSKTLQGDPTTPPNDATTAWKELTPLVAMPPPCQAAVNNRLSKQSYARLGRNLFFEARPAVSKKSNLYEYYHMKQKQISAVLSHFVAFRKRLRYRSTTAYRTQAPIINYCTLCVCGKKCSKFAIFAINHLTGYIQQEQTVP